MPEHSTLSEVFDKFNAVSLTQGTTRAKCRSAWGVLMALIGPGFAADKVTSDHILRYQRYLRDEAVSRYGRSYSEHSVFSYVAAIGEVFRWAAHPDRRIVAVNPVRQADRIRPTRREVHIYAPDEVTDLLDTVRGNPDRGIAALTWPDRAGTLRWTAFVLTGLIGIRVGEIWALRWDDIDLERGIVHIQSRPDRPGQYWRWTAKGKAERDVPMSDELWAVLLRLRVVASWLYPYLKEETCRDRQARVGKLSETQRKYSYNNFHRELKRVLKATNIRRTSEHREAITEGRFHTLRKNAATRMAEAGVPSVFCQEVLGHASDRLTKEVYTHVDRAKALDAARRAFNAAQ